MAVVVLSSLLRWAIWPSQHMGICSGVTTASGFGLSLLLMITNASPCTSDSGDTLLTAPSLTFWNRFHAFRQRTDPFKSVYKGRESRNNNEKKKNCSLPTLLFPIVLSTYVYIACFVCIWGCWKGTLVLQWYVGELDEQLTGSSKAVEQNESWFLFQVPGITSVLLRWN